MQERGHLLILNQFDNTTSLQNCQQNKPELNNLWFQMLI